MGFKLKGFQLLVMIACFNWLLMGSNIYHHFFYKMIYALIKWFQEN